MQFYRDESFRAAFRKEMQAPKVFLGKWERVVIHHAVNPAMQPLIGKSVAEVAKERGKDGIDTFLDLCIEDNLQLEYTYELFNADEDRIPELITHDQVMVGLSDGGAHVDMPSSAPNSAKRWKRLRCSTENGNVPLSTLPQSLKCRR
jgi:N-acyl-D-amino-acid deacylase